MKKRDQMQFPPVITDYVPITSVGTPSSNVNNNNNNFGSLGHRTNSFSGSGIPNLNTNTQRKTSKPTLPSSTPIAIGSTPTSGGGVSFPSSQPHSFGSTKQIPMNAQQQHQLSISPPFSTTAAGPFQSPPSDRFQPPPVTPPFGVSPPKNVSLGQRVTFFRLCLLYD
jgi:hypothetical protein